MNDHLRISVRRLDGSYRVIVQYSDLEHTHRYPFPTRERAERFANRVRHALDAGGQLNYNHWEYTGH